MSTLGLGFLLDSAYLLPLLISFLALALVTLAVGARGRRGYGPLAVGVLAAGLVLLGKFALASEAVLYPGLGLLIAASLWNSWPRKRDRAGTCGKCA